MSEVIDKFSGDNRFLSNFYPAKVIFDNKEYSDVESAYQASKTLDEEIREEIRIKRNPFFAKKRGKLILIREDWEKVKIPIMIDLVWQKFSAHEDLKQKLLSTGDSKLIEGNWWNDTFWGVCRGKGENFLGRILMSVRKKLKNNENY